MLIFFYTHSDLLGVALGTAALEIAKAGLNVEPQMWVIDLVAIVLGCLLGVFLPVLVKHADFFGGEQRKDRVRAVGYISVVMLFASVLVAGVPEDAATWTSFVLLMLIVFVFLCMIYLCCVRGGLNRKHINRDIIQHIKSKASTSQSAQFNLGVQGRGRRNTESHFGSQQAFLFTPPARR